MVGLIPAAGRGRRLGRLPVSKEVLPVEFSRTADGVVPKVACHYLLDRFRAGGIQRAFLVIRRGKEDVPRYLASGRDTGVSLAYVVTEESAAVPETLDRAYPFVRDHTVALGFPDLTFAPEDAYATLLDRHRTRRADVTLGLFPVESARRPTTDMIRLGADDRVEDVEVRPTASELPYNWLLAVWAPTFTEWLHGRMTRPSGTGSSGSTGDELRLGTLLREALDDGLDVRGIPFETGSYRDLGTPESLDLHRSSGA